MIQTGKQICHVDTCTRPGCSQQAGCQGHAMRELAPEYFAEQANALAAEAARHGVTLTFTHGAQPAALGGVPQGWKLVPAELLARFPELNPSNYDYNDACAVNAWGVEVVLSAAPAPEVGGVRKGWKLIERATHYQLVRGNEVIATLAGPDAEANAAKIAAMLSAAPAHDAPSAQDARDAEIETLKGERGVLIAIIRECDQVISTLEPESADEAEGLRQVLRSIKRITMLHQADERDLLGALSAQEVAHGNHA